MKRIRRNRLYELRFSREADCVHSYVALFKCEDNDHAGFTTELSVAKDGYPYND